MGEKFWGGEPFRFPFGVILNEDRRHQTMKREEQIFEQALALTSSEARDAYLLGACGDDGDLRRRVEGLLAAHQDAGALEFLAASGSKDGSVTRLSRDRLTEKPGDRIGRYKLLQQIG